MGEAHLGTSPAQHPKKRQQRGMCPVRNRTTAAKSRGTLGDALLFEILWRLLRCLHPLDGPERQDTFLACAGVSRSWAPAALQALWENPVNLSYEALLPFEEAARSQVDLEDSLPLPAFFSAAAAANSCCKNLRAPFVRYEDSDFKPVWPLSLVANVIFKCPKLVAFEFQPDIETPATTNDFWASSLGQAMRQALGCMRALALPLPENFEIAGALGPELAQWTASSFACSLVKVDLCNSRVTDVGVEELLGHCFTIDELDLTSTEITDATIIALQDYQPLTFLGVGANGRLFDSEGQSDAEIETLILALGSECFQMSAALFFALVETCPRLVALMILGMTPDDVLVRLAVRLPRLQYLGVSELEGESTSVSKGLRRALPRRIAVEWFYFLDRKIDGIDLEVSGI
ncbi:hypothetical protein BDK51DRAFT_40343 [Blyttiomyces helicus]|uniref:F-box domain-containing protein n=1 Tax=Blyttiomyces helicus TaxID=388810 RepID=A0A4P9VW73_9FUNG|nr:hypothetical protein BDK51DRAFT_40343 [Blyttiomyces helicus]|eukprot:RKO83392.1 hypothetical protein BDK51DRAFT_40343 [Blyttiomyces helicus]